MDKKLHHTLLRLHDSRACKRLLAVALACFVLQSVSAATRSVQTLDDSGPGSLRQALETAKPRDTIVIRVRGTIFLESPLFILKSVQIRGAGTDRLIIDGQNKTLAISVTNGVRVGISDLTVSNAVNFVFSPDSLGGAIQNFGSLTLTRCIVTESGTEFGAGGGIGTTGDLTVRQCTISHNSSVAGGGIANGGGNLVVDRSTINANRTDEPGGSIGGGIFQTAGTAALVNSTISGNTAFRGNGGGIWTHTAVLIESCTIVSNVATSTTVENAGRGGGIFADAQGNAEIHNTIIAGNTAENFSHPIVGTIVIGPDIFGLLISQGWNLIQNPADATITGVLTGNILGQDPLLGALQNNGGPTFTHALSPLSPAVDTGALSGVPRTDQRGVLRPQDGNGDRRRRNDIGAYELGGKGGPSQ